MISIIYRLNAKIFTILICLFVVLGIKAQPSSSHTVIKGVVIDSISREPLPFALITLKGSTVGAQSDEEGKFELSTSSDFKSVNVSYMGYSTKNIAVSKGKSNSIVVELVSEGVSLQEFTVKPGREKYSRKNNPAVAFMEKLRDMKDEYSPKNHDCYSYDKYEKMTNGFSKNSNSFLNIWTHQKFPANQYSMFQLRKNCQSIIIGNLQLQRKSM